MAFFKKKNFLLLSGLVLLLVAIPLAISTISQPQETRSKAAGSATLSFQPSSSAGNPIQVSAGSTVSLDIMINPGAHLPTLVRFQINFDSAQLKPAANSFVSNTTAFPLILEGPVIGNNTISAAVSIGADPTRVIRTPTKVGTLTFTAIGPVTGTPSSLVFGDLSRILSASPTDGAGQNVLSTTVPAYVKIIPSSTVKPTTSPTKTPSASKPAPPPQLCSKPPSGTAPIIVEPTGTTILSLNVLLHGVGSAGDNPNPGSAGNSNPVRPQRTVKVEVYDTDNKVVATASAPVSFDGDSGAFVGKIGLGKKFPTGNYSIKIKSDGYLNKILPGALQITTLQENEVTDISLITGDTNCDNTLNVIDYNAMLDCGYGKANPLPLADPNSIANSKACQAHAPIENVDLDDNGVINSFDYNLFLRELSVLTGD